MSNVVNVDKAKLGTLITRFEVSAYVANGEYPDPAVMDPIWEALSEHREELLDSLRETLLDYILAYYNPLPFDLLTEAHEA